MKSLIAFASTAIQLVYVLSLFGFVVSLIKIIQVESMYASGDPKTMAGGFAGAIIVLLIGAVVGLFGVILAWLVLRNRKERPSWFLPVSTFLAWTWFVFVPIGTVVGILMLRWRKPGDDIEAVAQA